MNWVKLAVIGIILVIVTTSVVAYAVANNATATESDSWLEEMREHHDSMHGDDFEEHHQLMHGDNWEEHMSNCHSD